MKMNKLLLFGIVSILSVPVMGVSAKDVLRQAREDYYKSLKAPKEPKVRKEKIKIIDENGVEQTDETATAPKTPLEKLEYNASKAAYRVDLYERVVRSVQREEKELKEYNDVLGKNVAKRVGSKKAVKPKVKKK